METMHLRFTNRPQRQTAKSSKKFAFLLAMLLLGFTLLFPPLIAMAQTLDHQLYLPLVFKPPYEPAKGATLAYPNCEDIDTLQAGWYINNSVSPSTGCPTSDKRFVPRIYSVADATNPVTLTIAVQNARASGWLIGFVEPNLPWHGNISPQQGAQAWRTIEQAALPQGIKLVAPSPSQHNPGYFDPLGYT